MDVEKLMKNACRTGGSSLTDAQFSALLSVVIIPKAVEILAEKEGLGDISSLRKFYNSKTYDLLEKEETKT
ncbi:MAG: hypothetical protein HUJ60_01480 [Bacilli bacterium]|nr:hypothetical protein [Bacilli bacterium]